MHTKKQFLVDYVVERQIHVFWILKQMLAFDFYKLKACKFAESLSLVK